MKKYTSSGSRCLLMFIFKNAALSGLLLLIMGLTFQVTAQQTASPYPSLESKHTQTVVVPGFEMNHQGGVVMDLTIEYMNGFRYSYYYPTEDDDDMEDFKYEIQSAATTFLDSYPNTSDFFEIVNRGLNEHLRNQFPDVEKMQVRFRIEPRPGVNFVVLSGTRFSNNQLREFYGFILDEQETSHPDLQNFDTEVWFEYVANLEPQEIPNVLSIRQTVQNFINNYPHATNLIEVFAKDMAQEVLDGFDALQNVAVDLRIPEYGDIQYKRFLNVYFDRETFKETTGLEYENPEDEMGLQGFTASFNYVTGIQNENYPDLWEVDESVTNFLNTLSPETSRYLQLYDFLDEYWPEFDDNLLEMNITFRFDDGDALLDNYYIGSKNIYSAKAGLGVFREYEQSPDGESINLRAEFMESARYILAAINKEQRLQWINQKMNENEYGGNLVSMNYQMAFLISLPDFYNPGSADINTSVEWITESFSSVAKVEGIRILPVSIDDDTTEIPNSIVLEQNYPNPFNPTTQITYSIPFDGHVNLTVYNSIGQRINTLVNEVLPAGQHNAVFSGQSLSSGLYFYRIEAGNQVLTRSMVLIK